MSYEARLSPGAERKYVELSGGFSWLMDGLDSFISDVAADPAQNSRRVASPPYPPGGRQADRELASWDGSPVLVTLFFLFSEDEKVIVITHILVVFFGKN